MERENNIKRAEGEFDIAASASGQRALVRGGESKCWNCMRTAVWNSERINSLRQIFSPSRDSWARTEREPRAGKKLRRRVLCCCGIKYACTLTHAHYVVGVGQRACTVVLAFGQGAATSEKVPRISRALDFKCRTMSVGSVMRVSCLTLNI